MPTPTYTPLANITLGSSATSISFSSIPATYRDLVLVVNGSFTANTGVSVRFNSDTGSNYSNLIMWNDASSAVSQQEVATVFYGNWTGTLSGTRYAAVFQVMDYSATDKHKTALWRTNYTSSNSVQTVEAYSGRWANTAALTALTLTAGATNGFATGTTFALYAIAS
jgi:hypothetical protein